MLRAGELPSLELVEAIAVAKVVAVEESISLAHRLKNEVGSYALMAGTGFDQTDFLQCCKFAEGDSRILMQKMARDRMRHFAKDGATAAADSKKIATESIGGDEGREEAEVRLCRELSAAMAQDLADGTAADKNAAWDNQWQLVYALAEAVMHRITADFLAAAAEPSHPCAQ